MGIRSEFREHQAHAAKPSSTELARRNRESGLNQAIKVYSEMPPTETLDDGWVGVVFEGDIVTLRGYKNGVLSEIVGTEVV